MKTYLGTIRLMFFSSLGFIVTSALQVLLNIYYERYIIVIICGIILLFYSVFIVLIGMDLIKKDTSIMEVRISQVNNDILTIIKPNGKKRKFRVIKPEIGKYSNGQELELTLTKRTRQIMGVEISQAEPT